MTVLEPVDVIEAALMHLSCSCIWPGPDKCGRHTALAALVVVRQRDETLRRKLHQTEGHNQFFERCESAWCHPTPEADPCADGFGKAWRTPTEYEEENARLRGALKRLVGRLDAVHAHPHYQSVWQLYMIHGGDYTNGPKYEDELAAARASLLESPEQGERNSPAGDSEAKQ